MDHSEGAGFSSPRDPSSDSRAILRPFALIAEVAFSHFIARCASPQNYRLFLEQTLFYVSETVPTLKKVAEQNWDHPLAADLMRLAHEETGHDDMIRDDLKLLSSEPSKILMSPALEDYVALARSIPAGMEGVSLLCGDIVAMEGYPPTTAGVKWMAEQFDVPIAACSSLLEHARADAIHGPLAFERLSHPLIDSSIAIGRAIETLRIFTRHWEWMTENCKKSVGGKKLFVQKISR